MITDQTPMGEVSLDILNIYVEDGEEVRSNTVATVPLPAEDEDLEEWAYDHLFPLTGTGRTKGDAGYFVTITKFDLRPELVGAEYEWGT